MSAVEHTLDFEDLLQTVKESDRGRWFLAEFERRLHKSDTNTVLAAIAKLENVMATQGAGAADNLLVTRARSAISAARTEIASLDASKSQLSDEGRLFAKLADMARTAFPEITEANPVVTAGVSRALMLVDQLDQDFAAIPALDAKSNYIARDADVFEPIVAPKTVATPAKSLPKAIERGARLVIRKVGETVAETPTPPASAQLHDSSSVAAPIDANIAAPTASVLPIAPALEKSSRVVIIRRKADEVMDVPLVDEDRSESAA